MVCCNRMGMLWNNSDFLPIIFIFTSFYGRTDIKKSLCLPSWLLSWNSELVCYRICTQLVALLQRLHTIMTLLYMVIFVPLHIWVFKKRQRQSTLLWSNCRCNWYKLWNICIHSYNLRVRRVFVNIYFLIENSFGSVIILWDTRSLYWTLSMDTVNYNQL